MDGIKTLGVILVKLVGNIVIFKALFQILLIIVIQREKYYHQHKERDKKYFIKKIIGLKAFR